MRPLDPTSGQPLYLQIADILRESLMNGEFLPGGCIPSTNDLADRFAVANMTVRAGIAVLVREGLLLPLKGSATYVSDNVRVRPVRVPGPEWRALNAELAELRELVRLYHAADRAAGLQHPRFTLPRSS